MGKMITIICLIITLSNNIFTSNPIDREIIGIETEIKRIDELLLRTEVNEEAKWVLRQKKSEYDRRIEFLKDSKSNNAKSKKTNKSWVKTEVSVNDLVLKKGEMYCYPNPAINKNPKLHIEVGYAEKVEIVIYDISGRIKDKLSIKGEPEHTVSGYAYETEWKAEGVGSGVYIMEVKANKGSEKVSGRIKCAIIR